jgi:hypothetical protein
MSDPILTAMVVAGATVGLGVTLIVRELLPAQPQLAAALDRLAPTPRTQAGPLRQEPAGEPASTSGLETRVGLLTERHLHRLPFLTVPHTELLLLATPVPRFLGQKVLLGLLGLLFPTVFTITVGAAGQHLPILLPTFGGLLLGVLLFALPDLEVRRRADAARQDFARAICAYTDLTALERTAGAGATQALEQAATIADSWVFLRLREQLTLARLNGTPPWDGLHALATELALPELSDLADIMRLSGEEGTAVADTLRARSRGLRTALLSKDQARANEDSERMVVPVALLGLIFIAILGAPTILRIL